MGSRGSAMCEGGCVCERTSDGSPFLQAAEAAATDRGAGRDCVQSSTPTASSKELLQRMEENHQELHGAIQQLNTKEEKPCALLAAWLKEDKQENEALRQEIRHLEAALEEEEACHCHRKKEAETWRLCCRRWRKHSWRGMCWRGDVASVTGCRHSCSWLAWSWSLASQWLPPCSTPPATTLGSSAACCHVCCQRRPTPNWHTHWERSSQRSVRGCCLFDRPSQ